MKNLIITVFFSIHFFINFLANGAVNQSYLLTVRVSDVSGKRIPDAGISIDGGEYMITDAKGEFVLNLKKELVMPFKVHVKNKGYKVKQFTFFDSENNIEIILTGADKEKKKYVVQIEDQNGSMVRNAIATIDGKSYTSDEKGNFLLEEPIKNEKNIFVEGYTFSSLDVKTKENVYKINVQKKIELKQTLEISEHEINASLFSSYKGVFQKLADEINEEKKRLEEKNNKILNNIASITERLKNEKNLSKKQRDHLLQQAEFLEKSLLENINAFQKSLERTNFLVYNLKMVILEKDSIANVAIAKIEAAQKEKIATEKKSRRDILISSFVAFVFILSSIFLYWIYIKIRKQKKALVIANADIERIKDELAKNVIDLKQSNEQLEIFVYRSSHDIKGPLRSIMGLTTIGQRDVKDPVALNYFEHILQTSKKLDRLLHDLLQVAKVNQANVESHRIDFSELVKEVMLNLKHMPEYHKNNFNIKINDDAKFYSDRKLIFSILQNIIENSIKYIDPSKNDSYLNININADAKGATLKFSDNGLGIPTHLKSKVFDMFFKANESSNGTGLGLYIVKTTVEKLKGTIELESVQGEGSTFSIKL